MTAKEAISYNGAQRGHSPVRMVESDMPLLEVLPRLLDAPDRLLGVRESGSLLGVIDSDSMLEALGRQISARDDSSVVEVECTPADYSASRLAVAVEDSDAHLVDMLTSPTADGHIRVTMRVRSSDPTAAAHSLERYGYSVTYTSRPDESGQLVAYERLLELRTLMNI